MIYVRWLDIRWKYLDKYYANLLIKDPQTFIENILPEPRVKKKLYSMKLLKIDQKPENFFIFSNFKIKKYIDDIFIRINFQIFFIDIL